MSFSHPRLIFPRALVSHIAAMSASSLFRSTLGARISKLPQLPALPAEDLEEDETENTFDDSVLPGQGMGPPAAPALSRKAKKRPPNEAYSPLSGAPYFHQALSTCVPESGLDVRVYYTPPTEPDGGVFVCHHGAGASALGFACFAGEVRDMAKASIGVLAFDARRHGQLCIILCHRD